MELKYLLYFLSGGLVVTLVTYFACNSKGLVAAFIANLPVMTVITFMTIYSESGRTGVVSYAQGLMLMLVPWLIYVSAVVFLSPKLGFVPSLMTGIGLYLVIAFAIMSFKGA
jgi:uncharacterized membrane protein (GlpM family)